jgi:hypothetical protein
VVYGRMVNSDYRAAVTTAAEVLGNGVQLRRAARALLAEESLPVELAAALVAAHDQLDAALGRLRATLGDAAFCTQRGPQRGLDGSDTGVDRCDARTR